MRKKFEFRALAVKNRASKISTILSLITTGSSFQKGVDRSKLFSDSG